MDAFDALPMMATSTLLHVILLLNLLRRNQRRLLLYPTTVPLTVASTTLHLYGRSFRQSILSMRMKCWKMFCCKVLPTTLQIQVMTIRCFVLKDK